MFKRLVLSAFLAVALLSANFGFAAEINSISCTQIVTSPEMPPMEMKFYMKGQNIRIETVSMGKQVVMIKKGNEMITYYPDQNMAMSMQLSQEAQSKMNNSGFGKDPKQFKDYLDKMKMLKVGEEAIEGKPCDIYEFNSSEGKTTAWIRRDVNWPVKTMVSGPKGNTIVEFKNLKVNDNLNDNLFVLPAGTQMMDMSNMMQGAQQMMNNPKFKEGMQKMMEKYKK